MTEYFSGDIGHEPEVLPETVPQGSLENGEVRQGGYWRRAKSFAQLAVIGFEVSPLNEVARYSVFGTTLAMTGSPTTAAITYGVSTLVIESSATFASAPLLDSDKANQFANKITEKMTGSNIDPQTVINPVTQAGVAVFGGAAISMGLKKIKNQEVTAKENRNFGLKISGALGVLCTAEGYLIAEGITHPSPGTIGAATVAIGGLLTAYKLTKNKLKQKKMLDSEGDA